MNLCAINPDALRAFLLSIPSPIEEVEIFQKFYPQVPSDLNDFDFFQAHFYIHHGLYKLKQTMINEGYEIQLVLSKVHVLKTPPEGFCSWLDESTLLFCNARADGNLCENHKENQKQRAERGAVVSDPLQDYYLNLENINNLDESSFRDFADSGVFLASNIMQIQQALNLFSLAPGASAQRITSRFRHLVKESHPDSNEQSKHSFHEIREAYEVLKEWKKI